MSKNNNTRKITFYVCGSYKCQVCNQYKQRTHKNWISCGISNGAEIIHKQICRSCFEKRCEDVAQKIQEEVKNNTRNMRLCNFVIRRDV